MVSEGSATVVTDEVSQGSVAERHGVGQRDARAVAGAGIVLLAYWLGPVQIGWPWAFWILAQAALTRVTTLAGSGM